MSEPDGIYRERARLVAFVASLFPSVRAYADPHEPEWSVVYVDTPAGQLSWHIAESDVDLFAHVEFVPPNDPRAQWDGHTTEEKYERLAAARHPQLVIDMSQHLTDDEAARLREAWSKRPGRIAVMPEMPIGGGA